MTITDEKILYSFTLHYQANFIMLGCAESINGKFHVLTNNSPEYYLSETKRLDIEQDWNGKGKFPIREWWITDLSICDTDIYEEEDISNF